MQAKAKSEGQSSESRDFPPDLHKVEEMARKGSSALMHKIKERPLWCAGIATGAGFVLGGGLATPAALRLLRKSVGLVLQLTVMPMVVGRLQEALGDLAGRDHDAS
jgi:hypothetical protein